MRLCCSKRGSETEKLVGPTLDSRQREVGTKVAGGRRGSCVDGERQSGRGVEVGCSLTGHGTLMPRGEPVAPAHVTGGACLRGFPPGAANRLPAAPLDGCHVRMPAALTGRPRGLGDARPMPERVAASRQRPWCGRHTKSNGQHGGWLLEAAALRIYRKSLRSLWPAMDATDCQTDRPSAARPTSGNLKASSVPRLDAQRRSLTIA